MQFDINSRVSCIIPSFNDGWRLEPTLKSAASLLGPLHEIIVVNDGSNYKSMTELSALITSMRSTRLFKYISLKQINKTNGGPASARNLGLNSACCEWIIFLDSDDLIHRDFIEHKLRFMSSVSDKEYLAGVYGSFIWSDTRIIQPFITNNTFVNRDHIGRLGKVPGGVPSYLFRRSALVSIGGFDESLRYNEDFDLLLRLLSSGFMLIGDGSHPAFTRTVRANSLTRANRLEASCTSYSFLLKAYRDCLLSRPELLHRLLLNRLGYFKLILLSILENLFAIKSE
jgi:glycosyltransferase involved in cell wall biosynthesis